MLHVGYSFLIELPEIFCNRVIFRTGNALRIIELFFGSRNKKLKFLFEITN